ncbi:hypothetical protein WA026_009378 [Henosepilachna vigintioctopunctata]|uniref:Ubinuclein-1 n=1 Tax=Henosepilachna vigintioctopunctata TaxID=420089 RepID=A0AAW1TZ72_9CUCU
MSDINRVPIPYGSQQVSNKTKNVINKTIRIAVKLPQSNEDTCPEYNYKDELDAVKKRGSSKNIENGNMMDMLEDDDRDVRRIAMQMEQKYGKAVVSKKRRKGRKDDYADIGMGYDESDSFIDNTDGYDEIIPQNVTTVHGGFYINCGALEFKANEEDSDVSSDSSSDSNPLPKDGKRTLGLDETDGEDEEGPSEHQKKKIKVDPGCNGMQKALKKKLFSPNKILKKKRPSNVVSKKTVKDLLKEKRVDLNMTVPSSENDLDISVFSEGKNCVENGKNLSNSITDAIESVIKASDKPIFGADRISSQVTDEVRQVSLPENLPNNIAEFITKIKQSSAISSFDKKFTDEMNNLLLSLEKKCKCLGKPSKTKVYEHLSYFMKIDKQILIQHCKQLTLKDEDKKIKSLLQKLKAEIDKVMPSIISNYEKECEVVFEKRTLLQLQNQDGGEEKRRSIGRPKRKFQWNDQTRKFLKDTATIRKRSYLQQGYSKEKWEEELATFLKNNVIHLWPEGWMTMTALTKVCNKLFNDPKTANLSASAAAKKENKNTATGNATLPYPNVFTSSSAQITKTYSKTSQADKLLEVTGKETKLKDNAHKESPKVTETDPSNDKSPNGNVFVKVDYEKAPVALAKSKDVNQEVINQPAKFTTSSKSKEFAQETKDIFRFAQGPSGSRSKDISQDIKEVSKFTSILKPKDCAQEIRDFTKFPQPKEFSRELKEAVKSSSGMKSKEVKDAKFPTSFHSKDFIQEIKESSKFSNVNIIELDSANNFSNLLPKSKTKLKNESELPSISILMNKNSGRSSEKTLTNTVEKQLNMNSSEDSARNMTDTEDIQNVMERLKHLQKITSPLKTEGSSSSSTAFSQKASNAPRSDVDLMTSSFQDEFQKQLNYKCS